MNIYFAADLHWYHKGILRNTARGKRWDNVEQMNEDLIAEWNELIQPNDLTYVLGDFSMGNPTKTAEVFYKLNGRKILIVGNHDNSKTIALPWEEFHWIKRFKKDGLRIVLCHYPLLTWQGAHQGAWHLHGHSHGNVKEISNTRMDVGYDAIGKIAISLEEVIEIMSTRSYVTVDHHIPNE